MILPLIAAAAVVGVGAQIYGAITGSEAAKKQAEAQAEIARLEGKVEEQRFHAMQLDSKRRTLQEFRKAQMARALVLSQGIAQGVKQTSSVYGGAFGQIGGESGGNILALGQSLEIGENVFGLNQQISQQKVKIAKLGGDIATAGAISSVGKSITSSLGSFGRIG